MILNLLSKLIVKQFWKSWFMKVQIHYLQLTWHFLTVNFTYSEKVFFDSIAAAKCSLFGVNKMNKLADWPSYPKVDLGLMQYLRWSSFWQYLTASSCQLLSLRPHSQILQGSWVGLIYIQKHLPKDVNREF